MTRERSITAILVTGLFLSLSTYAQDPDYPRGSNRMMPERMPMLDMPYPAMDVPPYIPPPPGAFTDFPTAAELSRMVPREPITEDRIKKRFADRKEKLKKLLDQDRKAAVKYAQDFSKYQKQQADNLVKLMAKAEQRRTAIFKRLEAQEKRVLEQFRQQQQGGTEQTQTPASEPAPSTNQ